MADDTTPDQSFATGFTSENAANPSETQNAVVTTGLPRAAPEPNTQTYNVTPALTNAAQARDDGYSWPEIDQHLADFRDRANQFGYADSDVDNHLGFQDASASFEQSAARWQQTLADTPDIPDKLQNPGLKFDSGVPWNTEDQGQYRDDYLRALLNGTVKGPQDFADMEARSVYHAMDVSTPNGTYDRTRDTILANLQQFSQQIKNTLPDPKDLVDTSIAIAQQAGLDVTPQNMALINHNVLANWADTGEHPLTALQRAMNDPQLRAKLTDTDYYKFPDLSPVVRSLEAAGLAYKAVGQDTLDNIKSGVFNYNDTANSIYRAFPNNPVNAALVTAGMTAATLASGSIQGISSMFSAAFLPPIAAGLQLMTEALPKEGFFGGRLLAQPSGANEPFESVAQASDALNIVSAAIPAAHMATLGFKMPNASLTKAVLQSEALRTGPAAAADIASQLVS